jgi:hypothetical protein
MSMASTVYEVMGYNKEYIPRIIPLELAAKIFSAPSQFSTKEVAAWAGCTHDDIMKAYDNPRYYLDKLGIKPKDKAIYVHSCKWTPEQRQMAMELIKKHGPKMASKMTGISLSTIRSMRYRAKEKESNHGNDGG